MFKCRHTLSVFYVSMYLQSVLRKRLSAQFQFADNFLYNINNTIYVNKEILQCDVAPYIENGRTMVPMRKIFEALDAKVDLDGTTQTITATKDDIAIIRPAQAILRQMDIII